MASLFRDFSFSAAASSPHAALEAERAAMNCSPTSLPSPLFSDSRPLTPPPCTVGDLAQLLGGHNLFISTSRAHPAAAGLPTPPSEQGSFSADIHKDYYPSHQPPHESHEPHHLSSPPHASLPRPTYCRASASILRMQRQANARLQCCTAQARDISQLVRMLEQEQQCTVNRSEASTRSVSASATPATPDEAIGLDYDCPLRVTEPQSSRPLYRAGDRHNDSVRVSKTVRMRKRSAGREVKERRKTK